MPQRKPLGVLTTLRQSVSPSPGKSNLSIHFMIGGHFPPKAIPLVFKLMPLPCTLIACTLIACTLYHGTLIPCTLIVCSLGGNTLSSLGIGPLMDQKKKLHIKQSVETWKTAR